MNQPCWGYHVSAIPAETERIVDGKGREWLRAGPRSWQRLPRQLEHAKRMHEAWVIENCAPVRCASTEDLLEARDAKLTNQLTASALGPGATWLPGHPTQDPVAFEDALMLMRAGWVIWPVKQRREALEALRQTEADQVAMTS